MTFQTILEELDRLYEGQETVVEKDDEVVEEFCTDVALAESVDDEEITIVDDEPATDDSIEASEDETAEVSSEDIIEEPTEEAQFVLECASCGGLTISLSADVEVDDELGLANVGAACKYCDETTGYKVIGTFVPNEDTDINEDNKDTEAAEDASSEDTEAVELEEGIFSKKNSKEEWTVGYRDENGRFKGVSLHDSKESAIDDRNQLEKDHPGVHYIIISGNKKDESLEELLDAKINLDATNFGGTGNDVSVLGGGLPEELESEEVAEEKEELEELLDADITIDAKGFGGSGNKVGIL